MCPSMLRATSPARHGRRGWWQRNVPEYLNCREKRDFDVAQTEKGCYTTYV